MVMKKFINDPQNLTKELLEGYVLSHPDLVELVEPSIVVNKNLKNQNRVAIMCMGGTGHEPAGSGVVGDGMLDAYVGGDIFAAPGPQLCVQAVEEIDRGQGVLFIVTNHPGDMLSAKKAMKMLKAKPEHKVRLVVTQEDISSMPRSQADDRRGLVGCVFAEKIAGGAAMDGKSLDEVADLAQLVADNIATLSVAARGATHPATGNWISELAEDEMEIGMGQHGEGGHNATKMKTADETAAIMMGRLLEDLSVKSGDELMVIINGSGATTLMEMFIVYRACYKYLEERGIKVVGCSVGEHITTQEQAGFQMSICKVVDERFVKYWNAPCKVAYFQN